VATLASFSVMAIQIGASLHSAVRIKADCWLSRREVFDSSTEIQHFWLVSEGDHVGARGHVGSGGAASVGHCACCPCSSASVSRGAR